MENEFFLRAGFPPPTLYEQSSSSSAMPSWQALSSAMEIQASQFTEQSSECFFNPNWEKSTDQNVNFDSAISSMVSSPAASNNNFSNESFVIRELIGKLGNIGNSGEISPHSHQPFLGAAAAYVSTNNSANNSCYSTPLNSPPKVSLPMVDHLVKENFPKLPNSLPLNSSLADFSADPGFAERAAKFSCFGSRSFNGRTRQLGMNNAELPCRSGSLIGSGKLSRVSSSPSMEVLGSQVGVRERKNSNSPMPGRTELANSQEESTVSEQKGNGQLNPQKGEPNSRKRKAVSRSKGKEPASAPATPAAKTAETNDESMSKRSKPNKGEKKDDTPAQAGEEQKGNSGTDQDEKQNKADQKPPEPPKDYIHVRARRGQATDSHSLAERVRREKISERMKLLQDLVPGCNKVTGKALMLDEIINYVQSLQRQVEFLSMKLASVNTKMDFNVETIVPKNIYQSNNSLPHPVFPIDSSASAFYGHHPQQNPALSANISNGTVTQCSVDPSDSALMQTLGMQLPPLNGFNEVAPQFPPFCEDDLQTIVQMGFGKNPNQEAALQSQSFEGSNQVPQLKVEL